MHAAEVLKPDVPGLPSEVSHLGGYTRDGHGGVHPFAIGTNPLPSAASGGPAWNGWDIARGIVLLPSGKGGYVLDGWGGIHGFGIGSDPLPPAIHSFYPRVDVISGVTITGPSASPVVVTTIDSHGGLHASG